MTLRFFDGPEELTNLAAAAAEVRHGVRGTLRLLWACRRPTPRTTFWRDGHHPTAMVHAELAHRAGACLASTGLLSPLAPATAQATAPASASASALASASQHDAVRGEAPQAPLLEH